MNMHAKAILILAMTGMVLLLGGNWAQACSCAPPPPPCQAIGYSELVFLGTVTELTVGSRSSFKTAKMRVDRAYKGTLENIVELFDDGMCDGPDLKVGHQYLMYTHRLPTGAIPARGCTRSRRIEDAEEDLRFLSEYSAGTFTTYVGGTIRFRPDEPEDSKLGERGRTPLKDVAITLSSGSGKFQTTTDASGKYRFSGLQPGEYSIEATLSGYRENWGVDTFTLHANGCAEVNILMKCDRRAQGIVLDENGRPLKGALVEMTPVDSRLKRWEQPILMDVSDENGAYAIDGIPPGEYFLGVNIRSTPRKEYPFPTTYYPNASERTLAQKILFPIEASVQSFDIHIPFKLHLVKIEGRILSRDGSPPALEDRPEVRIKEPGLYGQIEQDSIRIDKDGSFTFELCEGILYSAFAFSGPIREQIYSAPVEFRPTDSNNKLELTLDKTQAEFNQLSRK